MLNRVEIMGRLTRDPELSATSTGTFFTHFSIATESDFKDAKGEKVTEFFDVVAWKHTAEFINKYFGKGKTIVIAGRLKTNTWVDDSGNNRKSTQIVAESAYFGDAKKDSRESNGLTYIPPQQTQQSINELGTDEFMLIEDEDLPF